jgi:uncharacterized SAM-binding protein YcdF (DUF218 family)
MRNPWDSIKLCHNGEMKTIENEKGRGSWLKSISQRHPKIFSVLLALLVLFITLWSMGGMLVVADRLERADAIVVLSGGGSNDRILYATRLYQEGYAEYLVLTETGIKYPGDPTVATQYARDLAMDQGVPEEYILAPEVVVSSTKDEAQTVLKTAQASDFTRLIVVTDPYHTFRTRLIFRSVFRDSGIKIIVHPISGHWYDSATWFLTPAGWRDTLFEYFKTIGFYLGFG